MSLAAGSPAYANLMNNGAGIVQVGDVSRTAPSTPVTIFTAGANGSRIERLVMEALGPLSASVLRLFLYDGATYHLYDEQSIGAYTPAAGSGAVPVTMEAVNTPFLVPITLKTGWSLRATINDTQIASAAAAGSIAASQTTAGAAKLTLNGSSVTAASTTAIAAAATIGAAGLMSLTSAPYPMANPAQVTLTSTGNISGVNFTIFGTGKDGSSITETIAGPNNATVYSANVYASVLAIYANGAVATATSAGYSAVAGSAVLPLPSPITLFSIGNLSAVNFTIVGTNSKGLMITEVLAGPNVGLVTSVNTYASITSITTSGAAATAVQAGNPAILSGIKVNALGGDFS